MRYVIILMSLCMISATPKKYPIKLIITSISSYCGGAAPSEEMLKSLALPRPIPYKKLYLKKGEVNSFDNKFIKELMADSLGIIKIALPAGKYFVVDEMKKDQVYYNELLKKYDKVNNYEGPVDVECLKKWYATPEMKLNISSKGESIFQVNFDYRCFYDGKPCIPYNGPMPP